MTLRHRMARRTIRLPRAAFSRHRPSREPGPATGPVGERASAPDEVLAPNSPRASVADRLVAIVRERTGYPAEMLKPGLDLEADLGIDSIKRVEILGTLRESVDGLQDVSDSSIMDGLTRARTLGEIVERVEAVLESQKSAPSKKGTNASPSPRAQTMSPVRRLVLDRVAAPMSDNRTGLSPGGTVVITDDGRGVAQRAARRLPPGGASGRDIEPGTRRPGVAIGDRCGPRRGARGRVDRGDRPRAAAPPRGAERARFRGVVGPDRGRCEGPVPAGPRRGRRPRRGLALGRRLPRRRDGDGRRASRRRVSCRGPFSPVMAVSRGSSRRSPASGRASASASSTSTRARRPRASPPGWPPRP